MNKNFWIILNEWAGNAWRTMSTVTHRYRKHTQHTYTTTIQKTANKLVLEFTCAPSIVLCVSSYRCCFCRILFRLFSFRFFLFVSQRKLFDRDHISALFSLPLQSGKHSPVVLSLCCILSLWMCTCIVRVLYVCISYSCTVLYCYCMFRYTNYIYMRRVLYRCILITVLKRSGSQVILILYAS